MKHANPPRLCGVRYIMYYYSTLLQVYPLIILLLLLLLMVLHNIITISTPVWYIRQFREKRSNLCEYSKLIAPSFPSLFFPWPALLFGLLYNMVDICKMYIGYGGGGGLHYVLRSSRIYVEVGGVPPPLPPHHH